MQQGGSPSRAQRSKDFVLPFSTIERVACLCGKSLPACIINVYYVSSHCFCLFHYSIALLGVLHSVVQGQVQRSLLLLRESVKPSLIKKKIYSDKLSSQQMYKNSINNFYKHLLSDAQTKKYDYILYNFHTILSITHDTNKLKRLTIEYLIQKIICAWHIQEKNIF